MVTGEPASTDNRNWKAIHLSKSRYLLLSDLDYTQSLLAVENRRITEL